jgi:pimeloyl-ACP methyl ester carboxylesterase
MPPAATTDAAINDVATNDAAIIEHMAITPRHKTFYLATGPANGTPIIFVHGWPELSLSWRHQLPVMASLGFRAIAPDMRGYGRSGIYASHADYAQERIVADMIDLLDHIGAERAIWVGHDWGSPVVWNLASHHPDRCHAVANLCVPYGLEKGLDAILPLIDRNVYPEAEFPAGQWEYMRFYEENFDKARAAFDANPIRTIKALFRKGNPAGHLKPSRTAFARRDGGFFGGADAAPDVPRDADVISQADLYAYASALQRNGFFGPDSWYMNHIRNGQYAATARNGGRLDLPVLFLHGQYDYTCETITSRLAEPMRELCTDLTEHVVASGHWMAQEQPRAVNAHLVRWLAAKLPLLWLQ